MVVIVELEPCRLGLVVSHPTSQPNPTGLEFTKKLHLLGRVVSQPTSPSQQMQFFGNRDGHCTYMVLISVVINDVASQLGMNGQMICAQVSMHSH